MRLHTLILSLSALLFSFSYAHRQDETPQQAMQTIAKAAGLDAFGSVESISYTFKADLGDRQFTRSWTWLPASNEVTLHGKEGEDAVTYQRSEINADAPGELTKIDQQFVNDLYWLIFPLQVVWDSSVSIVPLPAEAAAVFPEAHAGLRIRYPEGVGYTPGDVYDLFYDENYRVTHWVFRKAGSETPTRPSVWTDYQTFGELSISLNRITPEDGVRIWFEDVSVDWAE